MGKDNRQRRAAKARRKIAQRRRPRQPRLPFSPAVSPVVSSPPPQLTLPVDAASVRSTVDELLDELDGPSRFRRVVTGSLVDVLARLDADTVRAALASRLRAALSSAWEQGWQPTDLSRCAARHRFGSDADLLRTCFGEEIAPRFDLGRRVAPAWMAQLDALGVAPLPEGRIEQWLRGQGHEAGLAAGVELLALLVGLYDLPRLVDPPSAWVDGNPTTPVGDVPATLLARIRALLAKAESTEFDAEAEAFTAKAQELMARHRIDRALLADALTAEDSAEGVIGRRVSIDDPYATAKFHLLAGIAEANGARTVWSKHLGMATVFGFPIELDIVEELFTSLLVQATSALHREGSKVDVDGRSRTTAFRRSFLLAFGDRVEERLRQTVDRVVDEATVESGTDLVPLFAERADAVAARVDDLYPKLRSMSISSTDPEGAFAGRLAADRADLSAGPPLRRSA
jgi:hypothetical protein